MDCRHLEIVEASKIRGSAPASHKCELVAGSSPNAIKFQKDLVAIVGGSVLAVTQGCPFRASGNYQGCPRYSV